MNGKWKMESGQRMMKFLVITIEATKFADCGEALHESLYPKLILNGLQILLGNAASLGSCC